MSENIKAFLEADALRGEGQTNVFRVDIKNECGKVVDVATCYIEGTAKFIAASSRIGPDLAKMVEDIRVAKEALQGLHDDNMDYLTKNHLGGENNHWMKGARESLTRLKPYEKLFEKEGDE